MPRLIGRRDGSSGIARPRRDRDDVDRARGADSRRPRSARLAGRRAVHQRRAAAHRRGGERQPRAAGWRRCGLLGTYGFVYGPAPTWVYQVLVAITRDLVVVAALHILLMSAATAGALWWLSRSLAALGLVRARAAAVAVLLVLRPRPLGQSVPAPARRARDGRLRGASRLRLAARPACLGRRHAGHPARASDGRRRSSFRSRLHMLVVRRRALWAHRYSLAAIAAGALLLAWPYWTYLAGPRPPAPGAGAAHRRLALSALRGTAAQRARTGLLLRSGAGGGAPVQDASARSRRSAMRLVWGGIAVAVTLVVEAVRARDVDAQGARRGDRGRLARLPVGHPRHQREVSAPALPQRHVDLVRAAGLVRRRLPGRRAQGRRGGARRRRQGFWRRRCCSRSARWPCACTAAAARGTSTARPSRTSSRSRGRWPGTRPTATCRCT